LIPENDAAGTIAGMKRNGRPRLHQNEEAKMPGEAVKRQREDEDTQVGFEGHMTTQVNEEAEESPENSNGRRPGPERTPSQPNGQKRHQGKKSNRERRK
jgi:hypothetical protein